MVKGKGRAAVAIQVPQSKEEARDMLAAYGTALRDLEHIETDLNQALADTKKAFLEKSEPIAKKADDLFYGLQTYCDANRITLTSSNTIKTVDLGTGKVSWRWNPPKVTLRGKLEDIIARVKNAGDLYQQFLRPAVEIDKVEMLRNPTLAQKIEGVKIASAGETFTVEPFADEQIAQAAQ